MSGETAFPGGFDTAFGAYAQYFAGLRNDILGDGSNIDEAEFMTRVETGVNAAQVYGARVVGKRTGVSYNTSSSPTSVLASTISIPANLLRAGSILEVRSRGVINLNSGSPTVAFTAKLGSVSYSLGTTAALSLSANPRQYELLIAFTANTVGATADIHCSGRWGLTVATTSGFDVNSTTLFGGLTPGTVDTTADQAFDLLSTLSVSHAANGVISGLTTVALTSFIG